MGLEVNYNKCDLCQVCTSACPFNAIVLEDGRIAFTQACRLCKICIKQCPQAAISLTTEARPQVDKEKWRGVMVYVEHEEGKIHPVTWELVGKARELAAKINHPVYGLFLGENIQEQAPRLLEYGVDKVFVYDDPALRHFRVDAYTQAFAHCVDKKKPSIILVGATAIGRSLAPRLATRFRTGLTADCTVLDVKENTDLVQIRPAFGGNIMAQIITPNHRPQLATVRYKVMDSAEKVAEPKGVIELYQVDIQSRIQVQAVRTKDVKPGIAEAEVLVVAGRGIREEKDMGLVRELAQRLGGQVAVTRPLIEAGWGEYTQQIGLSGRTVRPKLMITLGVSGSVQFVAGMRGAECIIAINKDKSAPIFDVAHYGIAGDLYEIVPNLLAKLRGNQGNTEVVK